MGKKKDLGDLVVKALTWLAENWEHIYDFAKTFIDRFKGKKFAIIGPKGVGKSNLYSRLQGKDFNKRHIETAGQNKIESFNVKFNLNDEKTIDFKVKGALDVGGEAQDKIKNWESAIMNADYTFYMLDMEYYQSFIDPKDKEQEEKRSRVYRDLEWLRDQYASAILQPSVKLHILINKIDTLGVTPGKYKEWVMTQNENIMRISSEIEGIFENYTSVISGITFISLQDMQMFRKGWVAALTTIHNSYE